MKAIIIKTGLEVFVRQDITPTHSWTKGMVAVSKQETGMCYFCVEQEELKIIK